MEASRSECRRRLPVSENRRQVHWLSDCGDKCRNETPTLVEWPRVDDHDAELLALPLRLEEDALDDAGPRVRQDDVAVFELFNRVLLDHAAGEEDAVADERVDLGDQERFRLGNAVDRVRLVRREGSDPNASSPRRGPSPSR